MLHCIGLRGNFERKKDMGVDTKAIIRKGTTVEQIVQFIAPKYGNVEVREAGHATSFMLNFKDGEDQRTLWAFLHGASESGIEGPSLSFGCWGNSVEIMRGICEHFGGYLDENDCDADGYYPINFHLYQQGEDFTPLDEFRHEVIQKIGYDKLHVAMQLLEKFKTI